MRWTGAGRWGRGVTLLEILLAVFILAIGLIPVFQLLFESRRMTASSIHELQAISMASSLIDAWKRLPAEKARTLVEREWSDDSPPPDLGLDALGVPPASRSLRRRWKTRLVNAPILPGMRFSDPWGKVLEIAVTIEQLPRSSAERQGGGGPSGIKEVLTVRGYHPLKD